MTMDKYEHIKSLDVPALTIRKNGSIAFNSLAAKQLPVRDKRYAEFYYDKDEKMIGIHLKEDNVDKSAFTIALEKDRIPTISCQGFLRHFGIPYKERSRAYPIKWNAQNNMVTIKVA